MLTFDERAAALGIGFRKLTEHTGAEVTGVDLSRPLPPGMPDLLREACAEHIVLLFRGQLAMGPARYIDFARLFGDELELHRQRQLCHPDHHEIFVVSNVVENGKPIGGSRVGLNWHTDHYHLEIPARFTFLHALEVPPEAGETRYANGYAAYQDLPDSMKQRIDPLKVHHSRTRMFLKILPEATEEDVEKERALMPDVWHPLVRTHPDTGRRGLFLGGEAGSMIDGLPREEAEPLFRELLEHMIQDKYLYTHHWQPGDVLMSDNRGSIHRAREWDEVNHRRILWRVTVFGDRPY